MLQFLGELRKVQGVGDLLGDAAEVGDGVGVGVVGGVVLDEEDDDGQQRQDDQVVAVDLLPALRAQVDGVAADVHGVVRHQGGRLGVLGQRGLRLPRRVILALPLALVTLPLKSRRKVPKLFYQINIYYLYANELEGRYKIYLVYNL